MSACLVETARIFAADGCLLAGLRSDQGETFLPDVKGDKGETPSSQRKG
jgi:hypothetical protein